MKFYYTNDYLIPRSLPIILTESGRSSPLHVHPPTKLLIQPHTRHKSYLRIANFSPDAPNFDVYIDDKLIAKNLTFGEQTSYITILPSEHKVKLYESNSKQNLILEHTISVPEHAVISTLAISLLEDLHLTLVNDDISVQPNEILIKFSNMSPDTGKLTLIVNLERTFIRLNFGETSDYTILPRAVNYNFILEKSTTKEILFQVPNMLFQPGKAYTLYVIGLKDGDPPLQLVTSLDGSSYFLD
jgi:hypothetical protein